MINAFQETTKWSGSTQNHIYFLDDESDRLVGYVVNGKTIILKNSMQFNRSNRTFKQLKMDIPQELKPILIQPKVIKVAGSKGNVYYIDPIKNTCTCPGFKYRSTCRHIQEHLSR